MIHQQINTSPETTRAIPGKGANNTSSLMRLAHLGKPDDQVLPEIELPRARLQSWVLDLGCWILKIRSRLTGAMANESGNLARKVL